jgi:hypothetical protein
VSLRTTAAADGHTHVAVFNGAGDGWTTSAAGHYHLIEELELEPARDGHTHELTAERVELDELDEVPGAKVA